MLKCWIIGILAAVCLWGSGYFLGRSHAKVEIVEKQVEVVRYVQQKKSEIAARPNAGRDELLNLMRSDKL